MNDAQRTIAQLGDQAKTVHRVVVIDDDERELDYMATLTGRACVQSLIIDCFNTVPDALEQLTRRGADLVLIDDHLAYGEKAEQSLERLRKANYRGPVAIMSGIVTPGRRERLMRSGIIAFLDKDEMDRCNLNLLIEMAKARDQMFRRAPALPDPSPALGLENLAAA